MVETAYAYACEKVHMLPPDDTTEYWRILVYETDENGFDAVVDITHHNKEEWADRWLEEQWGVTKPPAAGQLVRFNREE